MDAPRQNSHLRTTKLQNVLDGEQYVCTYAGTGQYSQALERGGKTGDALVMAMLQKETMEEIMSVCALWTSDAHLEVDDIYKTPLFEATLKHISTDYGKAEVTKFEDMLRQLDTSLEVSGAKRSNAIVITRPPEIITCLKVAHPVKDIYAIFDSHPRAAHPDGAAFILNTSRKRAARYLAGLLPVDLRLLAPDSGLQWQAELLAHVSGHFFEYARSDLHMSPDALHTLLVANCAVLRYKAQESEAKSQCSFLTSENERLKRELNRIEEQVEQAKRDRVLHASEQEELRELREYKFRMEWESDQRVVNLSTRFGSPSSVASSSRSGIDLGRADTMFGSGIGLNAGDNAVELSSSMSSVRPSPRRTNSTFEAPTGSDVKGKGKASDIDVALSMQIEYQREDASLQAQMLHLQTTAVQETFDCSICMDKMPLDYVARVDGCGHMFCRECIRQYISTKLEEHKFPIPCPSCSAQNESARVGNITESMIHQIGLSDKSYAIFVEFQLTKFSIPMECRKCKRSAFVDKREYEETKILTCPFPTCTYLWCKDCQQEIPFGSDVPHSCDGSTELQHLMDKQGWKHCPGCRTPTEKIAGCNHMTCSSPGCNTHFCYICGGLIVRSTSRNEINGAVGRHYRMNCTLFDVPHGI